MSIRTLLGLIALAAACASAPAAGAQAPGSAAAFKALGLSPVGGKSYVQPLRLREQAILADRSTVEIAGEAQPLGQAIALDPAAPQAARTDAELVFIGYGLPLAQVGHDDFAGQDLKGKIAVYLDAAPAFLAPDQAASARALMGLAAERAGAAGLLAIPLDAAAWDERVARSRLPGRFAAETALQDARGDRFVASLSPAAAERLFARAGRDFAAMATAARAGRPLLSFPLGAALHAEVATRTAAAAEETVVAALAGEDPYLARNYVVISARASQAQPLLDLAASLSRAGSRPQRSVIFAVLPDTVAEDLAARAVSRSLGADRDNVVAALHLQAGAATGVQLAGAQDSSLGEAARTAAADLGLEVRNADGSRAVAGFARAGAPSLALAVAPGESAYLTRLARRIADAAARPAWRQDSPFAPPAPRAQENLVAPLEMPVGKRPQKLLPSYG